MEYNGKDLSNCSSIQVNKDKAGQLKRLQTWCKKLQGEIGDKRSQDKRTIRVEKKKVGKNHVYIVSLELSGKSNKKSVFMKRVFYAQ
jgi:hypothetical protein